MLGQLIVASSNSAETGLRSFAAVIHPSLCDSSGILPPPAVGSSTCIEPRSFCIVSFSQTRSPPLGMYVNALLYPYGLPSFLFSRLAWSIKRRVCIGSPCIPSVWINFLRSALEGRRDANMAARLITSGRLAHQVWRRFGAGYGVNGVRSRPLSMPISAIGNHSSMSLRSDVIASQQCPRSQCRYLPAAGVWLNPRVGLHQRPP